MEGNGPPVANLPSMDALRLLHLADVHLGGSGAAFGARVREHQQRLQEAFGRSIDGALQRHVNAVCIAGDLFDSPRPSERTLQSALQQLRRLASAAPPIPCFILPGTHDALEEGCVYRRPEFQAEGLHVWTQPGPATFRLPAASLAVHGNPQLRGRTGHSPLEGLAPDPAARFNVALAHGGVLIPGITEAETSLITPAQIAASGMSYVALGHWHDFSDRSAGSVRAAYSGSPEVALLQQKSAGAALLVTLSDAGVELEPVPTGTLRTEALELAADLYPDEAAVAAQLEARASPDLLLDVSISGFAHEGFTCDVAHLEEEFAPRFFRLRLRDQSVLPLPQVAPQGAAEQLILARVVKRFGERVEQARAQGDAEAERLAQRALQLSVALLQGKEALG